MLRCGRHGRAGREYCGKGFGCGDCVLADGEREVGRGVKHVVEGAARILAERELCEIGERVDDDPDRSTKVR